MLNKIIFRNYEKKKNLLYEKINYEKNATTSKDPTVGVKWCDSNWNSKQPNNEVTNREWDDKHVRNCPYPRVPVVVIRVNFEIWSRYC